MPGGPVDHASARHIYELFNARDVAAMRALLAPNIEWDWSRSVGPDVGKRFGPDAVIRVLSESWEHWDRIEMRPGRLIDVDGGVIVDLTVYMRGRDGVEVTARGGHLQVWEGDLLTRYVLFQTLDDAIAAASQETPTPTAVRPLEPLGD